MKKDQWYSDAITWAAQNDIIKGYGDGFDLKDPITRDQIAVIFMNFAKKQGYDISVTGDLQRFADQGKVSAWAKKRFSLGQ